MILTAPFLFSLKRRNSTNIVQVLFTVGKNISDHIIELEVCYNKVYYTIEKSPVHVGKICLTVSDGICILIQNNYNFLRNTML